MHNTFTFNLITERWIPCIRADGEGEEFSVRETLASAQDMREMRGDTPLETAALHRLLLAVLHRVFGPGNAVEWRRLWQRRDQGFDMAALDAYLGQWQHKFDLFDDAQRFMQSRDPRVSEKSVISMVIEMASGNNSTLFDHHLESQDVHLSPAQAARALLVSQAFGIGGLSGLPDKFTDGPCAKGILFFAQGDTLAETLILNLMAYGGESPMPNEDDDCPAWERPDPFLPQRVAPRGYLDYLTWHNRKIWLLPRWHAGRIVVSQMCWAPGLRLAANDTDPHKQYTRPDTQNDLRILAFRAERALWRDSALLLRTSDRERPPKVVKWLHDLARDGRLDTTRPYRLMALGMAKDRASLEFLRAESLPLPPAFLKDEALIGDLSVNLALAERVSWRLRIATFNLARLMFSPSLAEADTTDEKTIAKLSRANDKSNDEEAKRVGKLAKSWNVEERFWSALEPHFHTFITHLPTDHEGAAQTWRAELRRAANAAFDYAERCVSGDPRADHAIAVASAQFHGGLKHLLTTPAVAQDSDSSEESES